MVFTRQEIPVEGDLWLAGFLLQYLVKQIVSPKQQTPAPLPANEIREKLISWIAVPPVTPMRLLQKVR